MTAIGKEMILENFSMYYVHYQLFTIIYSHLTVYSHIQTIVFIIAALLQPILDGLIVRMHE